MLNKNEKILIALASMGIVLSLGTLNFFLCISILFLLLITLRKQIAIIPGAILGIFIVISNIMSGDAIGVLFTCFIGYIFYKSWTTGFKLNGKLMLHHLEYREANNYALMFVIFIVFDMVFAMISGASVSMIISPEFISIAMMSVLGFLSIILIARKVFDAAYFYIGYLVINLGLTIFSLYKFKVKYDVLSSMDSMNLFIPIITILIQIAMVYVFIRENK